VLCALVLVAHILYFKVYKLTEGKRVFNSVTGVIGMNVNLYYFIIVYHNNAVAYRFKISAQLCGLFINFPIAVYYKFGAIGKGDLGFIFACGIS